MTQTPEAADLKKIEDSEVLQSIMMAANKYDLQSSPDWGELDQLSSRTEFEALEANPDGIFEGPTGSFHAIGDVYVTLRYGDKKDNSSMSDSYPVQIDGTFDRTEGTVAIERVSVDTSSFYR